MEMKIKNRLVEIRRFENVMTIVLLIVRPVDGLTCYVSTLNFAKNIVGDADECF